MINSRKDYKWYLEADRIALQRSPINSIKAFVKNLIVPDYIWKFQKLLRKVEYYKNCKKSLFATLYFQLLYARFVRLSLKLGFTIPLNVIGPGLGIIHYGTIVISGSARIGSNLRIHACTNIGKTKGLAPTIGNNCYIGPGAKLYGGIVLGNDVVVGANSVVNKSFVNGNIAIAGCPAKEIGKNNYHLVIKATDFLDKGITNIVEIKKLLIQENPYLQVEE